MYILKNQFGCEEGMFFVNVMKNWAKCWKRKFFKNQSYQKKHYTKFSPQLIHTILNWKKKIKKISVHYVAYCFLPNDLTFYDPPLKKLHNRYLFELMKARQY